MQNTFSPNAVHWIPCTSGSFRTPDETCGASNNAKRYARQQAVEHSNSPRHTSLSFSSCSRSLNTRRSDRLCVHASNQPSRMRETQQLPIFPLGLVAMPHTLTPLNIFEARYRVLFSTLLAGDEGIEEGLVNDESPFRASRKFGISLAHTAGIADIGTVLRIEHHKKLADGQIVIISRGIQRFKIKKVVQERPVMIADVELLPEEDDTSQEARQLAADVCNATKQLLDLNMKMRKLKVTVQVTQEDLNPPELTDLYPTRLSYYVASLLLDSYAVQQSLLAEDSTTQRLKLEKEIIESTLKYMSARFALQGAFEPSTTESEGPSESPPAS